MKPFLVTEDGVVHDALRRSGQCGLRDDVSELPMTGSELMYELGRRLRRWFMPAQGRDRLRVPEFCAACWPDEDGR